MIRTAEDWRTWNRRQKQRRPRMPAVVVVSIVFFPFGLVLYWWLF